MCCLQTIFKSILMNLIRFFRLPGYHPFGTVKNSCHGKHIIKNQLLSQKAVIQNWELRNHKNNYVEGTENQYGTQIPQFGSKIIEILIHKALSIKPYPKHTEDHSSRGLHVVPFCFSPFSTALHTHAHIIRVDTDKASSSPMRMQRPRKNPGQFFIRSGHSANRKEELPRG